MLRAAVESVIERLETRVLLSTTAPATAGWTAPQPDSTSATNLTLPRNPASPQAASTAAGKPAVKHATRPDLTGASFVGTATDTHGTPYDFTLTVTSEGKAGGLAGSMTVSDGGQTQSYTFTGSVNRQGKLTLHARSGKNSTVTLTGTTTSGGNVLTGKFVSVAKRIHAHGAVTVSRAASGFMGSGSFTFAASNVTTGPAAAIPSDAPAPSPATWMGSLADSTPLTDLSLPGTTNSAAGPTLQDALLGTGSSSEANPPSPSNTGASSAALVAHGLATATTEAALLAGGSNATANGIATAANTAALAADAAAGITQISSGAGLALGLTSDVTGLAAAVAANVQTALSSTDAADDVAAEAADTTAVAADTTAGGNYTAAGAADATAGANDAAAGTADTTAGAADTAAGVADTAAGTADTAAAVADGAAAVADVVSGAQGGIDPVSDGVTAALDTAGAVADTAAGTTNTAADAANGTADAANGTADAANATADGTNAAADAANATAAGTEVAADTADAAAKTANTTAATDHTLAAVADGTSSAAYVAATASDSLTADQYRSFAAGMTPDSAGGNSSNTSDQSTIHDLAATAATLHTASATAEAGAAVADAAATVANTTAASANTAAANLVAAATLAHEKATAANAAATAADDAAVVADDAATVADSAAITADSAAITADSTAEGFEAAAGIADGVSAGAETAAAAADTTAIALDITAAATIEIPFVDIATAAAAGIADGVAAGLDATSVAADAADATADGLAVAADGTAAALDATAAGLDGTAAGLDGTAAGLDATATAEDATATADDAAAAAADAAAVAACETATASNAAADIADARATTANHLATAASALALGADAAFYGEVSTIQNTQSALQTQTLGIADQLNAGIRSLDLRGAQVNDAINLNAGSYFTGVTLKAAMNDMTSFLQANPSETIVVRLSSNEASPINSSNSFAADLDTLLGSSNGAVPGTTYSDFIYSSSNPATTPTLGDVRGKIVIIPSGWTPAADATTGLTVGWHPTEVIQDSHTDTDPNTRWNDAENDNGKPAAGLIPTDLGSPTTLYRNNLSQDSTLSLDGKLGASPVALGDAVNAIAEQYFGAVHVTRTTGIVGVDDPDQTLINEIVAENNAPIVVTSDSDAADATGVTLREAITQANSQPGVNTIEFADDLTGTTGNTIVLQTSLPQITGDLIVGGSANVDTPSGSIKGFQAASTHSVTETNYVAPIVSGATQPTTTSTTAVYLGVAPGVKTVTSLPAVSVDPVHITYGTALADSQLHGFVPDSSGAAVPGAFSYNTGGTVLNAGDGQSEAVTFTPTDAKLSTTSTTVTVNVAKATPALSNVVTAVDLTYGTALADSQLSGTASFTVNGSSVSVPGTFVYTAGAGTVLHVGNGQSESISFIPTDTTDYRSVSSTVTVNVAQATPTVTLDPLNLGYGTPLDSTQLTGTATVNSVAVPGTFTFTSANGATLNGGSAQTEAVTFTPADTTDYATVSSSVTVNVSTHATPIVSVNPLNLTYGTALADSQLGGIAIFTLRGNTVIVPGAFSFSSATGTVLKAGKGQSEDVTFTPTDSVTYAAVSSKLSVTVNIAQATPAITDVNPVNITYGTALANGQLSGTATFTVGGNPVTVPGTFTYTTAAGSVLQAGNGQSETVTFTPTDTTDYTTASSSVTVNCAQATPIVGSVNPVTLIYGTALSDNPVAEVDTFTPAGTITSGDVNAITINLSGGKTHTVTFTTGSTTTAAAVTAGLVAAWNADPVAAAYATATGGSLVTLTCAVPGTTMSLTGSVTGVGTLTKTIATIATSSLSGTVSFTVNGKSVAVPGKLTYTSAAGSVLNIGNGQSENVTFTPSDTTDYTTASSTVLVNVLPITPTVTVTDAGGIYKGSPFAATGTATGVGGVSIATAANPTFVYYLASDTAFAHPLAGAPSDAGNYVAVCVYAASGNYGVGAAKTGFTIAPAATATGITSSLVLAVYGQQITYTATVTNTSGTGPVPVGVVRFVTVVDGVASTVSQVPLNASGQAVSAPIAFLTGTTHSAQAVYVPSLNSLGNTNFIPSSSTALNQPVQSIAVEGTGLYIGSSGALSNDQVTINPIGRSKTGSTGVQMQTRLNYVNTTTNYSQVFSSIHVYGQDGNDNIQLNSNLVLGAVVSAGNGNDTVTLGNGNNVVMAGSGNDAITAGNGNNLVASGFGNNSVQVGNGRNILIDGTVQLTQSGDSFAQVLSDWAQFGSSPGNVAGIRSRLNVTYNVANSQFKAGSGLDWFWYTNPHDTANVKPTDLHN